VTAEVEIAASEVVMQIKTENLVWLQEEETEEFQP
jgi:hypothetical protein